MLVVAAGRCVRRMNDAVPSRTHAPQGYEPSVSTLGNRAYATPAAAQTLLRLES